ncbi:MAG TPA: hypothetical protein VIS49_07740 [Cyclobacteriaceae bacterium]
MKSTFYFLFVSIAIVSCTSPRYAYHFDYYDYNSGKKGQEVDLTVAYESAVVNPEALLASKENKIMITEFQNNEEVLPATTIKKTYLQMTKSERRGFRSELKKFIKVKKESVKAAKSTNDMDNDLKLAAIFGAVGLVALIISGDVFYIIGGIALIIGVVFFVKWLVRQ